jgi:hypothetical protein
MSDASAEYLAGATPGRWQVLGVRLLPMTLGHAHVLASRTAWRPMQSCRVDAGILATTLYVCSRPWRIALRGVDGWRAQTYALWCGAVARAQRASLEAKAEVVRDYLDAHSSVRRLAPPLRRGRERDGGRYLGTPFLARLRLFAAHRLHVPMGAEMDLPMADLVWLWAADAEERGILRLLNASEESFDEFCRRMDEEGGS